MQVYKGRWNGVLVAVKILKAVATEGLDDFRRECSILERLRHPNIIKYFGMASNAEGQVSFARLARSCSKGSLIVGIPFLHIEVCW